MFGGLHVVGPTQAEEVIEAMAGRQILRQVAEVPFADASGGVAFGFERLGDGDFFRRASRRWHLAVKTRLFSLPAMPVRMGKRPVRRAARLGVQTQAAT